MSSNIKGQLASSDKDFIASLFKLEKASVYTMAKSTSWSYAAMFASAKKLEVLGLIEQTCSDSETESRRKIIYTLTEEGRKIALTFSTSAKAFPPLIDDGSSEVEPLSDIMTDFLLSQKRKETAEVDFKRTLDISKNSSFAEIAKDIFAMSNYGGGYLLCGFSETDKGSINPTGLPEDFRHIDQADLQGKFNSFSNRPIEIGYEEIERTIDGRLAKFAIIYVPPSTTVLIPNKPGMYTDDSGKVKRVFSEGDIFIRRGTQSIRADLEEIKAIEKRSKEIEQLSLLTGKPDKLEETLCGNFFKLREIPNIIFEAVLPDNVKFKFFEIKDTPFIKHGEKKIYSFCDVSKEPIGKYIQQNSFCSHNLSDFLELQDGRNIIIWLLNMEVRHEALKRGLRYDWRDQKVYFFPSDTSSRSEQWAGRVKRSTRLVAKQIYIKQLNSLLFIHFAASISFGFIGDEIFLKVLPRIVLTSNGYDTVQSFKEGAIKTRLTYNQYNYAYFNLVLFWISRFLSGDEKQIEFSKRVIVSQKPVSVEINVGIKSDWSSGDFTSDEEAEPLSPELTEEEE